MQVHIYHTYRYTSASNRTTSVMPVHSVLVYMCHYSFTSPARTTIRLRSKLNKQKDRSAYQGPGLPWYEKGMQPLRLRPHFYGKHWTAYVRRKFRRVWSTGTTFSNFTDEVVLCRARKLLLPLCHTHGRAPRSLYLLREIIMDQWKVRSYSTITKYPKGKSGSGGASRRRSDCRKGQKEFVGNAKQVACRGSA